MSDPFCPRHGRVSRPIEIPGLRCDCGVLTLVPAKPATVKLWVQKWEESERGWGTRPDGYTLHLRKEDIALFLREMRDREHKLYGGATPDEYSRPYGEPFEMAVDGALAEKVRTCSHGMWGPTRTVKQLEEQFGR